MRRRWDIALAAVGIWVLVLWIAVPAVLGVIWPPSYYMTISSMVIKGARVGEPELVTSDRQIIRPGERDVRVIVTGISDSVRGYVCEGWARDIPTVVGATPPTNMSLRRFMGELRDRTVPCEVRQPGQYSVSGFYLIHGPLGARIKLPLPDQITFTVHP